jgi:metal-sulfur cluster biosynthetic enzyme
MALTEHQVIEALRPVSDPELHVSIVELDMVRRVDIRRGRVAVTVALTVPGCPLREEITRRVTSALAPLPGVRDVKVELTVMTPQQLDCGPAWPLAVAGMSTILRRGPRTAVATRRPLEPINLSGTSRDGPTRSARRAGPGSSGSVPARAAWVSRR